MSSQLKVFLREEICTRDGDESVVRQILGLEFDNPVLLPIGYRIRIHGGKTEELVVKEGIMVISGSEVNVEVIVEKPWDGKI